MLKRGLVFCAVGLAAVALANHILVVGSEGEGAAVTGDGRVGGFNYSVIKRTTAEHRPLLRGRLRFEQRANDHGPWALIEMRGPSAIGARGNVAEFTGPGSLTRLVRGHRVTLQGHISVRVVDRRNPHHASDHPDQFRIHFTSRQTNFSFDGKLHNGDLVVFSRREH